MADSTTGAARPRSFATGDAALRAIPARPDPASTDSIPMPIPDDDAVPSPHPDAAARPARKDVGPPGAARASVRVIAAWEAVKGVLVLIAAGAASTFLRPDEERSVEEIVGHFHLNPAGHTSHIFERALERLADVHIVLLAVGALLYALLRFVEAYGLWAEKRWGWILGIASAALYLPLEVRELLHRFTWTSVILFAVNLVIVGVLWKNRTHHVVTAKA